MAITQGVDLKASVTWNRQDVQDINTITDSGTLDYNKSLASGTANGSADMVHKERRTIVGGGGTPYDMDLTAIATTYFGDAAALNMVEIVGIWVKNRQTTAGQDAEMGGSAAPFVGPVVAAGDKIPIPADSVLMQTNPLAGWAVIATTGDILRFNTTTAAAVTLDIIVVGRSA